MTQALLYCIVNERSNNKVHRQALFVLASQNLWTRFLMYFLYLSISTHFSQRLASKFKPTSVYDSCRREEWPSHKFMNHFGSPYLLITPHCLWKFSQSLYRSTKYSRNFHLRKASTPPKYIYVRTHNN